MDWMKPPGEWNGETQQPAAPPIIRPELLLIGLGNPILGDDAVGWRAAEEVRRLLAERPEQSGLDPQRVEFDLLSLGGLSLMERLIGYRRALLIDSIVSGAHPVGTIRRYELDELPAHAPGHLASAHDTSLQAAVQIGRSLGAALPEQIVALTIEIRLAYDFSEELSPQVAAALPQAARQAIAILDSW